MRRELLRARRSAESSEERVRILQDISSTFGVSVSDEDVAQAFANVARDAFSATETAVMLRDEDGRPSARRRREPPGRDRAAHRRRSAIRPSRSSSTPTRRSRSIPTLAAGLRQARLESLSITPLLERRGASRASWCASSPDDESSTSSSSICSGHSAARHPRRSCACGCSDSSSTWPCTIRSRDWRTGELLQRSLEAALEHSEQADRAADAGVLRRGRLQDRSTTDGATAPGMWCCANSPTACGAGCGPATSWDGSAVTSSSSSAPAPTESRRHPSPSACWPSSAGADVRRRSAAASSR